MKIGIVGWGVEGQSAFKFYGAEHSYLIVSEEPRDDFPMQERTTEIHFLSEKRAPGLTGNVTDLSYLDGIDSCDKIIYSVPSAKNLEKKFGQDKAFWVKATTIQHIFFEEVKTKNIIGVTGTKGKGTTSTLIYEMLKESGKRTFLGGNIGVPVLDFVRDVTPDDWVVLELSNFQLYNLTYSPHIGVCLMIVPEHLDWHPDIKDYTEAKANLFRHQKADDIAIYYNDNEYSKKIAGYSPGQKIPYYSAPGAYVDEATKIVIDDKEIIDKSEIKLLGEHNLQNICAALTAVWQVVQDRNAARKLLSSFSGLEHRLEFAGEADGVKYYDDSFGTAPDTAIVAMRSFDRPKIMILGGSDKGASFDVLAQEVTQNNVKHVIAIGATGVKIAQLLRAKGFDSITDGAANMPQIVAAAQSAAKAGDVVLLSTGCASFGMFKNYKDRGDQFKQAVQALS
jgi:UDP-N-acetylmuramoylalanine--D-glutamate ligase